MTYSEKVLEHYKHPLRKGPLPGATHTGQALNPLCGDDIEVSLILEGGLITHARFDGVGCAVSHASADILTGEWVGHAPSRGNAMTLDDVLDLLGQVSPSRHTCAMLPVRALAAAVPLRLPEHEAQASMDQADANDARHPHRRPAAPEDAGKLQPRDTTSEE